MVVPPQKNLCTIIFEVVIKLYCLEEEIKIDYKRSTREVWKCQLTLTVQR